LSILLLLRLSRTIPTDHYLHLEQVRCRLVYVYASIHGNGDAASAADSAWLFQPARALPCSYCCTW